MKIEPLFKYQRPELKMRIKTSWEEQNQVKIVLQQALPEYKIIS